MKSISGTEAVRDANSVQPFEGDRRLSLKTTWELKNTCLSGVGTAALLHEKRFSCGPSRFSALHRTHPPEPVPQLRPSISTTCSSSYWKIRTMSPPSETIF